MRTTVGQLLINESLPEDLQDHTRLIDKKTLQQVLSTLQQKHPDRYVDVVQKLQDLGREFSHREGGSFSLRDLLPPKHAQLARTTLQDRLERLSSLPDEKRSAAIISTINDYQEQLQKNLYAELQERGNPLAEQVSSGARGGPNHLRSLLLGDLMLLDHRDRPIAMPVLRSYAEGVDPAEYWAGSYGARKGIVSTKLSTADAGAWGKQVAQTMHQLVASAGKPKPNTGLPVETDDPDLVGYVLARPYAGHPAGTVITPAIASTLRDKHEQVLVHSPIEGLDDDGGLPGVAAGVRERGSIPPPGDRIGLLAAQALGEKLSQLQLSSKHAGGVVGASKQSLSGFELINNLIQMPKTFMGAAGVAGVSGKVTAIEDAPQGGKFLHIGDHVHYLEPGVQPLVAVGDTLEAGDLLTPGIPNPADLVRHKGIGEGRRLFAQHFAQAYRGSGLPIHRRNAELLARGLFNLVKVTELDAVPGTVPDDVLEYDRLAARWQPRAGAQNLAARVAIGKYLEQPALHYSIGTMVSPRVARTLSDHGIQQVSVHDQPPPFEPLAKRAMETLSVNPDWMVRFGGSYQSRGLLESVNRGRTSDLAGPSFVPAMITGEL